MPASRPRPVPSASRSTRSSSACNTPRTAIQFGKPLFAFPRVSGKLAWMATEIMIARQLTLYAAREKDADRRCDLEAGLAKLSGAAVAWAVADNALQIHGGNGYAMEYQISRVLCDARILNIFEGAAEIQAQVIARRLLERATGVLQNLADATPGELRPYFSLHGSFRVTARHMSDAPFYLCDRRRRIPTLGPAILIPSPRASTSRVKKPDSAEIAGRAPRHVEVDGERLQSEVAVEGLDRRQALLVDRQGHDLEIPVPEAGLQSVEGRHLLTAGRAPSCP